MQRDVLGKGKVCLKADWPGHGVSRDTDGLGCDKALYNLQINRHRGRGLGTNLYRLGVPEKTIQAILRHANVSTTNTYYIKSAADDTRVAMAKLEKFVIGNAEATDLQTGNEVATLEADAPTALVQ